jgi:hypothetical protein
LELIMKTRIATALALAVLAIGGTAGTAAARPAHNHGAERACWAHRTDSPRPFWYASLCGGYWWAK